MPTGIYQRKYKFIITKDYLMEKYVKQKITASRIGKEIGCSKYTILRNLIRYNISRRDPLDNLNKGIPWNKGKKTSLETRHKQSLRKLGTRQTKEQIQKRLRRRDKSSLEIRFQQIIDKYNLPYKFVGNGEFFIERKNPDFININGEKKAVEVYYRGHKEKFRGNIETWKRERQLIFNKYGWKLLFFDETQLNPIDELEILEVING